MKNKTLSSRALQAQKTRDKIFQTAVDMISQHGFDNVTIDDICRKSGVAKGSFYHYFKSKDDIIILTYENIDNIYERKLKKLPAETGSIEKIIFTVMYQAIFAKRSGVESVRQIYRSQVEYGTTYFISEERPLFKLLCNIISVGQQKNEIRTDLTADELTRFFLALSRGIIYDWCVHNGSYDIEKVMDSHFHLIINNFSATVR